MDIELKIIGYIKSIFKKREECPKQATFDLPVSYLMLDEKYLSALDGLRPGHEVYVFTWLHQGNREVLTCHPRGNKNIPKRGVFSTRSPDRPNPIGLHRVRIFDIKKNLVTIHPIEVIDNTPVIDLKPVDFSYYLTSFGPNIDPEIGKKIIDIGKLAWKNGLISGFSGNISVIQDKKVIITKSGKNKGMLDELDLVSFDLEQPYENEVSEVSSEWKMHLEIYKNQAKAKAVIHTHPTYLILVIEQDEDFLDKLDLFEADYFKKSFGIVDEYRPGSMELAKAVGEMSKRKQIIVLKKHGLVCWGISLKESLSLSEEIERLAEIYFLKKLIK